MSNPQNKITKMHNDSLVTSMTNLPAVKSHKSENSDQDQLNFEQQNQIPNTQKQEGSKTFGLYMNNLKESEKFTIEEKSNLQKFIEEESND